MANLILVPTQNVYISSSEPEDNFSNANVAYAGVDKYGSTYRMLMSFDLCLLPSNIVIDTALLYVYSDSIGTKTVPGFFTPYAVEKDWDQEKINWNNQPEANKSLAGKTLEVSSRGWCVWNITSIVQVWILESKNNYGIVIKSPEDRNNDIKRFHSIRSYYYRHLRPYLDIKYNWKSSLALDSRNTFNSYETFTASDTFLYSKWQNVSSFSMYTFFIQNIGAHPASVHIQISPDRNAVVNEAACINIAPGSVEAMVPQKYGFFCRLAFKTAFFGTKTNLKIWFQGQV